MILYYCSMANFEKVYKKTAIQVVQRCHGAIKITKHGKILEVYDTKRHIWSKGLAGLIIKEECKEANLKDWEIARYIRPCIIAMLLEDKTGLLSTRQPPDNKEARTKKRVSKYRHSKPPDQKTTKKKSYTKKII